MFCFAKSLFCSSSRSKPAGDDQKKTDELMTPSTAWDWINCITPGSNGVLHEVLYGECKAYFDYDRVIEVNFTEQERVEKIAAIVNEYNDCIVRAFLSCFEEAFNAGKIVFITNHRIVDKEYKKFKISYRVIVNDDFKYSSGSVVRELYCDSLDHCTKKFDEKFVADRQVYLDSGKMKKWRCFGSNKDGPLVTDAIKQIGSKMQMFGYYNRDRHYFEAPERGLEAFKSTLVQDVTGYVLHEKNEFALWKMAKQREKRLEQRIHSVTADNSSKENFLEICSRLGGEKLTYEADWARMIRGVKFVGQDLGFSDAELIELCDEISARSPKYECFEAVRDKYMASKPDGSIGLGTLIHLTEQPKTERLYEDLSSYFNETKTTEPPTPKSSLDLNYANEDELDSFRAMAKENSSKMRDSLIEAARQMDRKTTPKFNYEDGYSYLDFVQEFSRETTFKTEKTIIERFIQQSRRVIFNFAEQCVIVKMPKCFELNSIGGRQGISNFQLYVNGKKYQKLQDMKKYMRTVSEIKIDPENKDWQVFDAFPPQLAKLADIPSDELKKKVEPMIDYLFETWANGKKDILEYLLQWSKCVAQRSVEKSNVIIFLSGAHGSGKNTYVDFLGQYILGPQLYKSTNFQGLVAPHSTICEGSKLIVLEELAQRREEWRGSFEVLKNIATNPILTINPKGQKERVIQNISNVVILSNNHDSAIVESGDRRYLIIKCSSKYLGKEHEAYWENLRKTIFNQDFADLWYTYLMRFKSDIKLRNPPLTEEKAELIKDNLHHSVDFALEWINKQVEQNEELTVQASKFYEEYQQWCVKNGFNGSLVFNNKRLKSEMKKYGMIDFKNNVVYYNFDKFEVKNIAEIANV